ncbi:MAG: hypothetical protein R3D70_24400 [Rhizobiaceae bacterium]
MSEREFLPLGAGYMAFHAVAKSVEAFSFSRGSDPATAREHGVAAGTLAGSMVSISSGNLLDLLAIGRDTYVETCKIEDKRARSA